MKKLVITLISALILSTSFAQANFEQIKYSHSEIEHNTSSNAIFAKASKAKIIVDGENFEFNSYNINGYNYVKLRDIATILDNTSKEFEISWNANLEAIFLTSDKNYTKVGGELDNSTASDKNAYKTNVSLFKDEDKVAFNTYNIDGNNYFMLRDIANLFDFALVWDSASSNILIDTKDNYFEESSLSSTKLAAYIVDYYASFTAKVEKTMTKEEIFEAEVIELVNAERAKLGLTLLTPTDELEAAAQIRADECSVKLSHTRPDGTSFSTVFDEVGIETMYRGENLGSGYTSPERLVTGLMNSPSHKQNILNPEYRHIGVGYNETNDWSQLFTN